MELLTLNLNPALLIRYLDKFYNQRNLPWVNLICNTYYVNGEIPHVSPGVGSFWWKGVLKPCDMFRGIASCTIGNASTILFWCDLWNNNLLQELYPRLFSFANNKNISVSGFLRNNIIQEQFHIPLSE